MNFKFEKNKYFFAQTKKQPENRLFKSFLKEYSVK